MTTIYEIKEPEPIILQGYERQNGMIVFKKIFYIRYDNYYGCLYLENGEKLILTPLRLRIVEQLVEALKKGTTYVAGKDLMYKAGSDQFSVVNLFGICPNWRKFIESSKRGFYRLALYADTTYEDYIMPHGNDNTKAA